MKSVSIIMPNYNGENFLQESIESVLSQTYANWELIIIDDCSKDKSIEVIAPFLVDKRIQLIQLEQNAGRPSIPRNIALKKVTGEYIAFLDNDDIWHPQKLEIQLACLKKENVEFISSQKEIFYDKFTQDMSFLIEKDIVCESIQHSRLIRKNIIPNSSVLLSRRLLANEEFNELVAYKAIEDNHLWLRLHQKITHSVQVQYPLLKYRIVSTSISRDKMSMAKKTWNMLGEYKYHGKLLNIFQRAFYFCTYIYGSIIKKS